jgi:predicted transcriptional regulator
MTKHETRKTEILKIIADAPGIAPGLAMSRSLTCNKAGDFNKVLMDLTESGLVLRVGLGEKSQYHLTDKGHTELHGLIEVAPAGADADADDLESSDASAGTDDNVVLEEVVFDQPLPVIDLDQCTIDVALAEVRHLTAQPRKPANFDDCILFLREFSGCVQARYPVAAAMLNCSANHLEKVYQPDV